MKSVTIIWCDWGDEDTSILQEMWKNLPASVTVKLVHLTKWDDMSEKIVELAIKDERDTLLFCGHGTGYGLLVPNNTGEYVIHEMNSILIKAETVIGIMCYGKDFAKRVGLNGLFSGMFISNIDEACNNGITTRSEEIQSSNKNFFKEIWKVLAGLTTCEECLERIKRLGENDQVSAFNAEEMEIL